LLAGASLEVVPLLALQAGSDCSVVCTIGDCLLDAGSAHKSVSLEAAQAATISRTVAKAQRTHRLADSLEQVVAVMTAKAILLLVEGSAARVGELSGDGQHKQREGEGLSQLLGKSKFP
jgi:hypothetical protein